MLLCTQTKYKYKEFFKLFFCLKPVTTFTFLIVPVSGVASLPAVVGKAVDKWVLGSAQAPPNISSYTVQRRNDVDISTR